MQRRIRSLLLAATACIAGAWTSGAVRQAATAPLQVTVSCSGTQCDAWSTGGSGTYAGIDWNTGYEAWDSGGMSTIDMSYDCIPGYFLGVIAAVTDSNAATASNGGVVYCPNSWH